MFYAKEFNQNIDSWRVDAVTNMYGVFTGAALFNQPLNSSFYSWRVDAVMKMSSMFYNAKEFNQKTLTRGEPARSPQRSTCSRVQAAPRSRRAAQL